MDISKLILKDLNPVYWVYKIINNHFKAKFDTELRTKELEFKYAELEFNKLLENRKLPTWCSVCEKNMIPWNMDNLNFPCYRCDYCGLKRIVRPKP